MRVRDGGGWRDVTSGRVRTNNAWRQIVLIRAYISGAWKDVAVFTPPLSVSLSPDVIGDSTTVPGTYTSAVVTATPVGGRSPFTYSWARTSGDSGFSVLSPTSASTQFRRTFTVEGEFSAVFRCTVTDADANVATRDIQLTVNGFSGF
jgi:hypothetical protein